MHLKRLGIYIILAIILMSCGGKRKLSQAQKAYSIGEYSRAADLYRRAYTGERNKYYKGEYSWFIGESYRKINLPSKASTYYSRAVRYNYPNPEARYYMAETYRKAGKINRAVISFESYLEDYPADIRAQRGLASCMLVRNDTITTSYRVKKEKRISSRYSDFTPVFVGDNYDYVIFSSMRTEAKSKHKSKITGQGYSNLYYTKKNIKGDWETPKRFDEPINNDKFDDGVPCIAEGGKVMYFTRCTFDKERPVGTEIVRCERQGGYWGDPVNISIRMDSSKIDSTVLAHPAISPDNKIMYFVSDMEGGEGGDDIWMSVREGEAWGRPVNMGSEINTPGDEMFPYVRKDGTFYFCSDTHVGYGGLDIFRADKDETGKWQVRNMGKPINGLGDDFGITFEGDDEVGLFSSTRGNSRGVDNIYSFELPKLYFYLDGTVVNQYTELVPGAYLKLIGSDGTVLKISPNEEGGFRVALKQNTDYVLLIAADGYLNQKHKFSTIGLSANKVFDYSIELEKP